MLHTDAGLIGEVRSLKLGIQWLTDAALRGSEHLEFIVEHRLFRLNSPKQMEDLYDKIAPDLDYSFVTRNQILEGKLPPEQVILTEGSHVQMAKTLQVPELSGEVERAVWQVETALKKDESKSPTVEEEERKSQ